MMKILYRDQLQFKLLFLKRIRHLVLKKMITNVIVPGGNSLKSMTKSLIKSYQYNKKIKFILSDERLVSDKSLHNSQIYRKYFRKSLMENRIHVFNISSLRKSSNIYSKLMTDKSKSIAILGVGDDGHIAGIFKNQEYCSKKFIFFKNKDQNGVMRISIPISILSNMSYRFAYISDGKINALKNKESPLYLYNPKIVYSSSK